MSELAVYGIGSVVVDPELKTVGDSSVLRFKAAFNRNYKTRDGEWKEDPVFIRCELWGERATKVALKKGTLVYIKGYVKQDSYESKDGQKMTMLYLAVSDLNVCERTKAGSEVKTQKATVTGTVSMADSQNMDDMPF